jgi:hypothetical protein
MISFNSINKLFIDIKVNQLFKCDENRKNIDILPHLNSDLLIESI